MARIIKARVFRNIGTEAEWLARNPVLLDGEIAQVRFGSRIREKVGDGVLTFSALSYQDGELKVSKVTPSFPFVSGEGPAPEGIYMAGESGVYNGVTVDVTGKIVFLLWDGESRLEVVETEVDTSGLATKVEVNERPTTGQLGFEKLPAGINVVHQISPPNFSDITFWGVGALRANGTISASSTTFRYTLGYIPIRKGIYDTNIRLAGTNARILIHNDSFEIIGDVGSPKGDAAGDIVYEVNIPEDGYVRFSFSFENSPVSRFFRPKNDILTPTSSVFTTRKFVDDAKEEAVSEAEVNTKKTLTALGFAPIKAGTNILAELAATAISDEAVWRKGYLKEDGATRNDENLYYTLPYYRVYHGKYRLVVFITSNARVLVYDEQKNIVMVIAPVGSNNTYYIEIPSNGYYIRLSDDPEQVYISEIELTAIEDIYIKQSSVTGSEVKRVIRDTTRLKHAFKTRRPMVSFISDDGNKNELNWYIPIMRSKKVFSTLAIITSRMLALSSQTMHPEEVITLHKEGFEIAGHTHMHLQMATEMTLEEVDADLAKNRLILNSMGIDCPMFVAPFGSRNPAVDAIVRKYFKADFISSAGERQLPYANIPPVHTFTLNRVSFDAGENGVSTLQKCKDAVDEAIAVGGWVIFTTHPNYPEYLSTANPGGWEQRHQDLRDLIDYIKDLEVPILTAGSAFEYYKNLEEIGNRTDSNYYALGMDGSETGDYFN